MASLPEARPPSGPTNVAWSSYSATRPSQISGLEFQTDWLAHGREPTLTRSLTRASEPPLKSRARTRMGRFAGVVPTGERAPAIDTNRALDNPTQQDIRETASS